MALDPEPALEQGQSDLGHLGSDLGRISMPRDVPSVEVEVMADEVVVPNGPEKRAVHEERVVPGNVLQRGRGPGCRGRCTRSCQITSVVFRLVEHSVRGDDVTRLQLGPQLRQREMRRVPAPVVHPPAPDRERYPVQADRDLILRPRVLPHVLELEPEAPDLTLRRSVVGRRGFHVVDLEIVDVQPDPDGTAADRDVHPAQDLPAVEALDQPRGRNVRFRPASRPSVVRPSTGSPETGLGGRPARPLLSPSNRVDRPRRPAQNSTRATAWSPHAFQWPAAFPAI